VNGPRILQIPHFKQNIYDTLDIVKDGKVEMAERKDIVTTLKAYPNATFICHQFNNEFNYMVMKLDVARLPCSPQCAKLEVLWLFLSWFGPRGGWSHFRTNQGARVGNLNFTRRMRGLWRGAILLITPMFKRRGKN
jgi:hypothetical protein